MGREREDPDQVVIDVLRRQGPQRVVDLTRQLGVTGTAVRQRLQRLLAAGLVARRIQTDARDRDGGGRGRPSHEYLLTRHGERTAGSNFSDLAIALWQELRAVADPEVRRGLLQRLSQRLARVYAGEIQGETAAERMRAIARLFEARDVPVAVEMRSSQEEQRPEEQRPMLKAWGCPYTELAEQDRSICAFERMLLAELVGRGLVLSQCRLDGEPCCTFELN